MIVREDKVNGGGLSEKAYRANLKNPPVIFKSRRALGESRRGNQE
jgi:hypothetical protein